MRVVFLDIDGVLASYLDLKERCEGWNKTKFRDYSVSALNSITTYMDAKIVLSSTWRMDFRDIEIFRIFAKERGIEAEIISYTPIKIGGRDLEILSWLESNEEFEVDDYLVIDDETVGILKNPEFSRYKNVLTTNRFRCLDEYDAIEVMREYNF